MRQHIPARPIQAVLVESDQKSCEFSSDGDWTGALSGVSSTIGSLTFGTSYTHDGFGRIATSKQTTAGVEYLFSYQYSLADQLTEIHYPSGRIVGYVPDSAGRVQYVRNGVTSANYATMNYTPAGAVSSMAMGNGLTESWTWNDPASGDETGHCAGGPHTCGAR